MGVRSSRSSSPASSASCASSATPWKARTCARTGLSWAVRTLAHELGHVRADHEGRFADTYHRSVDCRGIAEIEAVHRLSRDHGCRSRLRWLLRPIRRRLVRRCPSPAPRHRFTSPDHGHKIDEELRCVARSQIPRGPLNQGPQPIPFRPGHSWDRLHEAPDAARPLLITPSHADERVPRPLDAGPRLVTTMIGLLQQRPSAPVADSCHGWHDSGGQADGGHACVSTWVRRRLKAARRCARRPSHGRHGHAEPPRQRAGGGQVSDRERR